MVDSYEFARAKKHVLTASRADPPRISEVELDGAFVRFEVPARAEWFDGDETLRDRSMAEAESVVVAPIRRVVAWYERLLEDVLDEQHLHVDVLDLDGDPAIEARCKYDWARERLDGERTDASFVSLLAQTVGRTGSNERAESASSPWHDVEDVPADLRPDDLE